MNPKRAKLIYITHQCPIHTILFIIYSLQFVTYLQAINANGFVLTSFCVKYVLVSLITINLFTEASTGLEIIISFRLDRKFNICYKMHANGKLSLIAFFLQRLINRTSHRTQWFFESVKISNKNVYLRNFLRAQIARHLSRRQERGSNNISHLLNEMKQSKFSPNVICINLSTKYTEDMLSRYPGICPIYTFIKGDRIARTSLIEDFANTQSER